MVRHPTLAHATDLYRHPEIYELAFSYRDIPREIDTVLSWYASHAGKAKPAGALELAAGPAAHAIELTRRGVDATALDLSAAMCAYARRRARSVDALLSVVRGDITRFSLDDRFDLMLCMCDSGSHLLDLDAMVGHLRSAAAHLRRGGIYVLELAHPADFLAAGVRTHDRWRLRRNGQHLEVRWRTIDPVDPVTQLERSSLTVRVGHGDSRRVFREELVLRRWTVTEIDAAVRLAGGLELAEWHGGFEAESALAGGWRMIAILKRARSR